jgi:hypothetical protein
VTIRNEGERAGEVNISVPENSSILVNPKKFTLEAKGESGSSVQLQVKFEATQLGNIQIPIRVDCESKSKVISVKAAVVSQSLELYMPDASTKLSNVHFGSLFFSQERTFTALLVNKGPYPSSFHAAVESKFEEDPLIMNPTEMTISPERGSLEANGQVEITFKFSPKEVDPLLKNMIKDKAIFAPVRDYLRSVVFQVVETGQLFQVPMSGRVFLDLFILIYF